MMHDDEQAKQLQMRKIAVVMAVAGVFWTVMQWLGPRLGLAGEYAFLIDLAAIGAFVWALVLALSLWRRRGV